MAPIIVMIAGIVILLINCYKKLRKDFKNAAGFKPKLRVLWSYAGIILGAAIISSSIFF